MYKYIQQQGEQGTGVWGERKSKVNKRSIPIMIMRLSRERKGLRMMR